MVLIVESEKDEIPCWSTAAGAQKFMLVCTRCQAARQRQTLEGMC